MLEVMLVFPWGGPSQAPYDHDMVRVVPWVLDGHVMKYPVVGSQYVVRTGPHYPPLPHNRPCPPILTPHPTSWEEVPRKILYPYRRYFRHNLLIPYQSVCSLQINV